ncbi:DUF1800 family protein [Aquabacterium sp.]|uniref:DUF1800 domain-containing protein n=1 Tax=Aquabacterium sp. TaxID=1872578 RepID=UPI002486DC20|nr:DUF1800 family protein [Aquabacterium sp.]MDI1350206.1 DUF1800 family protein [Aquabacterium sp.]
MALIPTRAEAARFLGHAALGYTSSDIEAVRQAGFETWIDRQFTAWRQTSHWDWLVANRGATKEAVDLLPATHYGMALATSYRRFIEGRDLLRQKMVFSLSQVVVASNTSEMGRMQDLGAGNHLDILEKHAFGNYRDLLGEVATSLFMGSFLTFEGSAVAGALGANKPDENFAREILQLFTIGLFELNTDGSVVMETTDIGTEPKPTYVATDVASLARAFTGWGSNGSDDGRWKRPMAVTPHYVDNGEKTFTQLRIPTIAHSLGAAGNMKAALDGIFAHSNVGPFLGRQLIQRMVTSNPSPEYVARVAQAFNNNGLGVRGDLKAVIKAVLLDPSLFDAEGRRLQGMDDPTFGKLREPVQRVVQWAKAFNVRSLSGRWLVGGNNGGTSLWLLGQAPMHAPSVFNFFRPGYVPPGTEMADTQLHGHTMVAPEFQITNEVTTLEYISVMRDLIDRGVVNGASTLDIVADYTAWLPKVTDARALVAELNVLLAAGQLSPTTESLIAQAVGAMRMATTDERARRIKAAALLVLSAPEFLAQK